MAKILIIEDDPESRELLKFRLEKAGHTVVEAVNGPDGLLASKNHRPDLVILDIMIPKMDGWQVCKALKADPLTRSIPVILLTGRTQEIEQLRGWESGASEFLTKPPDPAKLLEAIERLIKKG